MTSLLGDRLYLALSTPFDKEILSVKTPHFNRTELRAGNYPEAGDISERVDILRELAVEVNKSRLTVGEAVTGIAVVNSLKELGLEPGDIQQCVSLCKTLTPADAQTQVFVKAATEYQEVLERTGLGVEELDNKVRSLEEASHQLEPLAEKAHDLKGEIEGLEARKIKLGDTVAGLEKRQHTLSENVKEREQREANLSTRIAHLEEKLQSYEEGLGVAKKDLKALSNIGMSLDQLSGFAERLKGAAHRHGIEPQALYGRLLNELERLDKGLDLEALVQARQCELHRVEEAISKAQEKSVMLDNQIQRLQRELSGLKAQIADERESVSQELRNIIVTAQNIVTELKQDLGKGIQDGIGEIARLKKEALETGKELGQLEATIKSYAWLEDILSLLKGENKVSASQVRVLGITLLKSMQAWLEHNQSAVITFYTISTLITSLISELERWKPKANSVEGSKSLSPN
jgi:predicted  nucleic acid-binding Zn-ribbon protein